MDLSDFGNRLQFPPTYLPDLSNRTGRPFPSSRRHHKTSTADRLGPPFGMPPVSSRVECGCAPHTCPIAFQDLKAKKWVNTIYDLIWPCFQPTAGRPNQRPTTSIGHKSDALRCDMVQGVGSEMQDRLWYPHISMGSAKTARTGGLKSARRSLTCVGRQSCVTVSRRSGQGMPLAQDPPPCTIELPCVRPSGRHHFGEKHNKVPDDCEVLTLWEAFGAAACP